MNRRSSPVEPAIGDVVDPRPRLLCHRAGTNFAGDGSSPVTSPRGRQHRGLAPCAPRFSRTRRWNALRTRVTLRLPDMMTLLSTGYSHQRCLSVAAPGIAAVNHHSWMQLDLLSHRKLCYRAVSTF